MTIKLGVVMDPISAIDVEQDSTMAMLLEAEKRGWQLYYMEQKDLFIKDSVPMARMRKLSVFVEQEQWFELTEAEEVALSSLNVILMRKDPPVDLEYIYATHILELAEAAGALVLNRPQSLRDANEKLFAAWFPECCPPTVVAKDAALLQDFIQTHKKVVLKPLHGMGGMGVFQVEAGDLNSNVIIETLTQNGSCFIMAQKFIPEIKAGDKRILMINGEPIPYAVARIAAQGELRANLHAGGSWRTQPLTKRDREICAKVGPVLRAKGLWFVGLDVIGGYLTEINVTSPTCIREVMAATEVDPAKLLLDFIAKELK